MILNYKIIQGEVIKDFRNYIFYQFNKRNRVVLMIFILSTIVFIMNERFDVSSIVGGISFGCIVGSVGMLLLESFFLLRNLSKVYSFANEIQNSKGTISFLSSRIEILRDNDVSVVYNHQIEKVIEIKGTVFIIVTNSKLFPLRFNGQELGESGYMVFKNELSRLKETS